VTSRRLGIVLISVGLVGMIGSAWAVAARPGSRSGSWVGVALGSRAGPTCDVPRLPGQTVDVILSDRGGMMASDRMMGVAESPSVVGAGTVLFRVWNAR
jgi:hypothetical protein